MPECLEDLVMNRLPTPERPLLGVLVLVVEDSRFACDALRLICQRSGARIRRAESLSSATRHLRSYRPRVAIVDLGLPDGSGVSLIAQLARAEPRIDAIIATSGDAARRAEAIEAGADTFLAKPLTSIADFQAIVLGLLPDHCRPFRIAPLADDSVTPDPIALRDDLALAVELLSNRPDRATREYLAAFLEGLGRIAGDEVLRDVGRDLGSLPSGSGSQDATGRLAAAIQDRIGAREAV